MKFFLISDDYKNTSRRVSVNKNKIRSQVIDWDCRHAAWNNVKSSVRKRSANVIWRKKKLTRSLKDLMQQNKLFIKRFSASEQQLTPSPVEKNDDPETNHD